jgi:hypothetical protein
VPRLYSPSPTRSVKNISAAVLTQAPPVFLVRPLRPAGLEPAAALHLLPRPRYPPPSTSTSTGGVIALLLRPNGPARPIHPVRLLHPLPRSPVNLLASSTDRRVRPEGNEYEDRASIAISPPICDDS